MVKDDAEMESMEVEDSGVKFLEDLLRGSCVVKGDEMCVGGKAVHNDDDRCIAIGFVERAGEVYS